MSGVTRRVTTLKYTPAGTMQLVGSVKDSRLESASGACVGVGGERTRVHVRGDADVERGDVFDI